MKAPKASSARAVERELRKRKAELRSFKGLLLVNHRGEIIDLS